MRAVFDNSAQPGWAELETYATVNGPTNDLVSAVTNRVFVPQTPEEFAYDADGNLTEDGRFRYFWDGENRMVRAEEKMPPSGRPALAVTYAYDHQGRNVAKDGALHIWDGYSIVAENAAASNATVNLWGLDVDGTMQGAGGVGGLLAVERDGGISLPLYDANGNITEYLDSFGGIESHTDYSVFGRGLMRSGVHRHSHGFSTKPWCRKSGLVEYQMRKYMPWHGRWMSTDKVENLYVVYSYVYCDNKYGTYDILGLIEPSSFLDGVKDEALAKKLIDEVFPNDPKRQKDELRRWQKKTLGRRSSMRKLVKLTKKIVCTAAQLAKECGCTAVITITIILIPNKVGAEPIMIEGQPISEDGWLFDNPAQRD